MDIQRLNAQRQVPAPSEANNKRSDSLGSPNNTKPQNEEAAYVSLSAKSSNSSADSRGLGKQADEATKEVKELNGTEEQVPIDRPTPDNSVTT